MSILFDNILLKIFLPTTRYCVFCQNTHYLKKTAKKQKKRLFQAFFCVFLSLTHFCVFLSRKRRNSAFLFCIYPYTPFVSVRFNYVYYYILYIVIFNIIMFIAIIKNKKRQRIKFNRGTKRSEFQIKVIRLIFLFSRAEKFYRTLRNLPRNLLCRNFFGFFFFAFSFTVFQNVYQYEYGYQ